MLFRSHVFCAVLHPKVSHSAFACGSVARARNFYHLLSRTKPCIVALICGYFLGFCDTLLLRDSYKRTANAANGRPVDAAPGFGAAPRVLPFAASFVLQAPFLFSTGLAGRREGPREGAASPGETPLFVETAEPNSAFTPLWGLLVPMGVWADALRVSRRRQANAVYQI